MENQAVMRKVVMCRMPLLLVTSTLYHACRTARMLQEVRMQSECGLAIPMWLEVCCSRCLTC